MPSRSASRQLEAARFAAGRHEQRVVGEGFARGEANRFRRAVHLSHLLVAALDVL